ncbi:hypothetical protein Y032_0005g2508 [Ancylostoma ceylanicum]|uniref:Uncharacterized protein n=1 Tax=Ancylostoma ceylanicum TaxID=53326 RepID=A0A016VS04_9BILA|nr:hypothetical protein Y032_0005g2508 [Ancylostoma ceylanicum]
MTYLHLPVIMLHQKLYVVLKIFLGFDKEISVFVPLIYNLFLIHAFLIFAVVDIFQAWALTERGEIRSDDLCLSSGGAFSVDNLLRLERCNVASPNQKHLFKYDAEVRGMITYLFFSNFYSCFLFKLFK